MAASVALAAALVGAWAAPLAFGAQAADVCATTTTATTTTLTCPPTGEAVQWTPPAGVTQAAFDVIAGMGGSFPGQTPGAAGGRVQATIPVDVSRPLSILVGAAGLPGGYTTDSGTGETTTVAATVAYGGNGGGGSSVADGAGDLVVAGGGGGAGSSVDAATALGGDGGAYVTREQLPARAAVAFANGASGADGGSAGSGGGTGATPYQGGTGTGAFPGGTGESHSGGAGAYGGGGGGGGLYGGGGGSVAGESGQTTTNGAGGGGGSSWVTPDALTAPVFSTATSEGGAGSVTITYATPAADVPATPPNTDPAPAPDPSRVPAPFSATGGDDPLLPGPPAPEPVVDQTVVVEAAYGVVLVRRPGGELVPLTAGEAIPLGSVIDARGGIVRLTAETNRDGTVQSALFWGGVFRVTQVSDGRGGRITRATLTRHATGCATSPGGGRGRGGARATTAAARGKKKNQGQSLWGDGKGNFQTKGDHSAATVRGTKWYVENRCAGTYTRVVHGIVAVRDFQRHRTVTLTAGETYTARG